MVFQLLTNFIVSLLQIVPNSRPGPGSHRSLPHEEKLETTLQYVAPQVRGKLETDPYLCPFTSPCDKEGDTRPSLQPFKAP